MTDWHLQITTWAGLTAGARHYYGRIKDDDFEKPSYDIRNSSGSIRFDDRDELIAAAVKFWETEELGGILRRGAPYYEEREVLAE